MRILFTRFPLESAFGGAEIQTLSLMEGLLERGHAVAFAGSCPVLLAECRKRHIPVVELDIGKPPVTKWGAISFLWRKRGMRRKLETLFDRFIGETGKTQNPESRDQSLETICMLSLSEKLLLTDYASKKGANVFWIEHDRIGAWLTHNPWLPLLKEQSSNATVIPVSHLSGKIYEEMGFNSSNIVPIPNGVDVKRLRATGYGQTSKLEARSSKLALGCISRLSYEKGVDVLIEALAGVEDVQLEIVGSGREEKELRHLAEDLQLQDRVTFTVEERSIANAFARFDALVLPSRDNDPFGLVAAEAMMLGIPTLVTDQCGIAGYLTHAEDALIAKAEDPASLAACIETLKDTDIRKKLASNGEKTAAKKFSTSSMVDLYEDVFTGS